jgi:hypothetical protein
MRASERIEHYMAEPGPRRAGRDAWEAGMAGMQELEADRSPELDLPSRKRQSERWQVLYSDDELQITHRGHADSGQREQVRLAAELIKKILKKK